MSSGCLVLLFPVCVSGAGKVTSINKTSLPGQYDFLLISFNQIYPIVDVSLYTGHIVTSSCLLCGQATTLCGTLLLSLLQVLQVVLQSSVYPIQR